MNTQNRSMPLAADETFDPYAVNRAEFARMKLARDDDAVAGLLAAVRTPSDVRHRIAADATAIIERCRAEPHAHGTLDAFLHEFDLTTTEGVALMCLAESLLRVPDATTADRLIAERIEAGNWTAHVGHSSNLFVNASTWALMLTGEVLRLEDGTLGDPSTWLTALVGRVGEPIIRNAIKAALRILGSQFVLGHDIDTALRRAGDIPHSFDMLGEAARSDAQAAWYSNAYSTALAALARGAPRNAISIKLSALDPRFEETQTSRVMTRLYPTLLHLVEKAKAAGVACTLDAEEALRLELTLDLFTRLGEESSLASWSGLGLAVQAYQKRALTVIDWVIACARRRGAPLQVRLVKGAYWDAEIKHAQVHGLADYPVYTQKAATDLSYLVCAERLLAAAPAVFPQFATHNAHTIATILGLADPTARLEFQRLHGMGEAVYTAANEIYGHVLPVRVYGPVGNHRALLPYLLRRLLENGANSSFVNRFLDRANPVSALVADPVVQMSSEKPKRHPAIPLPRDLFAPLRPNSSGVDWADRRVRAALVSSAPPAWQGASIVNGQLMLGGRPVEIRNPADHSQLLARVPQATDAEIAAAYQHAACAQADWDQLGGGARAAILRHAGETIDRARERLVHCLVREAGKTWRDALDEVREAVDYCFYYAAEAAQCFVGQPPLPAVAGENNRLSLHGRGVFACISPWNFPLAIFIGQIAAALAAGNTVLAKPAPQTPLTAFLATRLLHESGVPPAVLHLLTGDAKVGAAIIDLPGIDGVAFTGSFRVAREINRRLAAKDGPICPFIAETGGQNAMIVDSTALLEAVVDDVLYSSFNSAGQRCSALRILLVQEEVAAPLRELLAGAMANLVVGNPACVETDVGPLIDAAAQARLRRHHTELRQHARILFAYPELPEDSPGWYFPPVLVEIDDWSLLHEEIFGPIVHFKSYAATALDAELHALRRLGFGLTLGVHSRIEGFATEIAGRVGCGNVYINRNMVGAVVGCQPFGGRGMSGTGPKAGGPNYLLRFATERTITTNTSVSGGTAALFQITA
ncbi:MAG: bifunctional proline dehydrogenase/L-glutamate gamma-semialdehyde dehydrogenase PutA [Gammaproteobacteria bacterium]|nr:bifunctional proline dehydrogenase/L-glutamate gamma-semialdehyde dehydrogenase PutA [Gammaproteobacteria bacterium]